MNSSYLVIWMMIMIIIINNSKKRKRLVINNIKRKRGIKMSEELSRQFIDKVCVVSCNEESFSGGRQGRVKSIDDKWLTLEEGKGSTRIINLEYVSSIQILPEKYQK